MAPIIASLATLLLAHAAYSSYEFIHHAKLHSLNLPFPPDVALEVGVALVLFLIHALILYPKTQNTRKLSLVDPKRIVVPATTLRNVNMSNALVDDEIRKASEFYIVENRVNYVDWIAKRAEFDQWRAEKTKD